MTALPSDTAKLPIAVLISGGGTTLRNLLEYIDRGELSAEVKLVVSSTPAAGGLKYATERNIPVEVVTRDSCESDTAFSEAIFGACRAAGVKLVVMGGFLKFVPIPADFADRVINIHPALIPAFCGKGFYGTRVHQAVLEYGAKVSGCTVHFCDDVYDHGPIVLQQVVPVAEDDTPKTLAARVFEAECQALPQAINLFAAGRVQLQGRRVSIR